MKIQSEEAESLVRWHPTRWLGAAPHPDWTDCKATSLHCKRCTSCSLTLSPNTVEGQHLLGRCVWLTAKSNDAVPPVAFWPTWPWEKQPMCWVDKAPESKPAPELYGWSLCSILQMLKASTAKCQCWYSPGPLNIPEGNFHFILYAQVLIPWGSESSVACV